MKSERSEMTAHAGIAAARGARRARKPAPRNWSLPLSVVAKYAVAVVWGCIVYDFVSPFVAVLS